ncbi:MAG: hypothetical protein CL897_00650 [Dehalococcoidia bacterium]|nr:hypothetical protein [Dehalococcoidia bacterium]
MRGQIPPLPLRLFRRTPKTETKSPERAADTKPKAKPPAKSHVSPSSKSSQEGAGPSPRRRRTRRRGRKRPEEARSVQENGTRDPDKTKRAPNAQDRNLTEPAAFHAIGVRGSGLRAIAALGFLEPTPIQERAMPLLYEGRDVVGLAQTGTGKTLAFGEPLARSINPSRNEVQGLVLLPTRELCDQVTDVMSHLGDFYGFTTIRLVGGKPVQRDIEALERGGHVIVGTPGRVIDHLKRRTLSLTRAQFVVLDEADEMLDIGFAKDIDQILRQAPLDRQTALFSATMPMSISRLVWRYMRDSERVEASPTQLQPVETIRQLYCEVASRDKFYALEHLHDSMDLGRSLIFRRTKVGVDRLTEGLRRDGIHARAIHGDLRQSERDRVMRDFRSGKLEWLVATNVAARGLDIPDIAHVVNYDVPQNAEEYIHRVGRTARAGKEGSAITFVGEWELGEWEAIVGRVGEDALEHLDIPTRFD